MRSARIDTPVEREYYVHGGILPYVLRQLRRWSTRPMLSPGAHWPGAGGPARDPIFRPFEVELRYIDLLRRVGERR